MATLTASARRKLPASAFVYPGTRSYPIHDMNHARAALSMVAKNGSPDQQATVKAAVYKRYPALRSGS